MNENLMCVREKVLDYGKDKFPDLKVYAILIYGGASKYYLNLEGSRLNDYDINLFFISEKSNTHVSTRGKPKYIDEYEGKRIEVMRNLIIDNPSNFNEETFKKFIKNKTSKRWKSICSQRVILIYPEIRELKLF